MYDIIGHRGAITYAHENTLSSVYALKLMNCKWIEADVLLTKDEIPVMFHDKEMNRLTNIHGSISDYNYRDIKKAILQNTISKIPLLKEFVDLCSKLSINIMLELKDYSNDARNLVRKVVSIIKNYNNIDVVICSYSISVLKYLNIMYPFKNILYIVDKIPDNWYEIIQEYKCSGISINYNYNDLDDIVKCANIIPTFCFTINDSHKYNNLVNTNVKGIITDKPEIFIKKCHSHK